MIKMVMMYGNTWSGDSSREVFTNTWFKKVMELLGVKRFLEAEIMHGRVAMMATVGYLIG